MDKSANKYTLGIQILSVSIFERAQLSCAFQPDKYTTDTIDAANQLIVVRVLTGQ